MFDIIIIALFFSAIAGLWDLKTTEVPDEIPAIMIIIGISYWLINASIFGNISALLLSIIAGTIVLALGLVLYKKGQWGGADAWILAAIIYMLAPIYNTPGSYSITTFIIPYVFNFFIVSAAYMIIYALALGFMNKKIFSRLSEDLKKNKKIFLIPLTFIILISFMTFYAILNGYAMRISSLVGIAILITLLTVFWRYGKIIEKDIFKKRIPSSKLRPGDVLEEMNWIGLTPRQVSSIKKKHRYVTIKEGVRFVPVFFIALLVTIIFGNILFAFVGL